MNKRQLIDAIRKYNPTARVKFLEQFDESALRQYLDHLESAHQKPVKVATWVRKPKQPRLAG